MNRRELVTAIGTSATFLAGCTSLSDSSTTATSGNPERDQQRPASTSTPQPDPELSWSEQRIAKNKYKVTVTAELNGTEKLNIVRVDMSETPAATSYVTSISESGTHTIAGPDADVDPLPAALLRVEIADGTRDVTSVSSEVAEHVVGSSVTEQSNSQQEQSQSDPDVSFLDGISGSTLPDTSITGFKERTFTQSYPDGRSEFSLGIPEAQYQYYKDRPRTDNYGAYVSDQIDDRSIKSLADTFENYGEEHDQTARQIADHAIAWVQGMKYTQDKPATGFNEYPKYPAETLVDRGGDCEDTSILLASVFEAMGYGTVLLEIPDAQHMAVGVAGEDAIDGAHYTHNGRKYYYVETTGSGWRVGQVPDSVQQSNGKANIQPVNSSPSLALKWNVQAPPPGGIVVGTGTYNMGDAVARSAAVQAEVETKDGQIVAQQREPLSNIQPGGGVANKALQLSPPGGQELRVRVGALLGNTLSDVVESDYHSP